MLCSASGSCRDGGSSERRPAGAACATSSERGEAAAPAHPRRRAVAPDGRESPVTRRAAPSSGCAAVPRMDITFAGQNCAGNSCGCDTHLHGVNIVVFFGAGTIDSATRSGWARLPRRFEIGRDGAGFRQDFCGIFAGRFSGRCTTASVGACWAGFAQASCVLLYVAYRSRPSASVLLTMAATALASIRRRVCSH